jgi:Caspase domain
MAQIATAEDRLLYFHSGHGTRINNELYLVPSDAYAHDDPDALIPLSTVKEILNKSEARQKFIILDACYSGPNTKEFKSIPAEVSNTFMKKYVAETVGVALLSSSADDQMSTTQSPDSAVSLFTYYLLQALQGDPGALDANKHLTLFSLHSFVSARVDRQARSYQFRQRPNLDTSTNGDFFFGDFGASPVELQGLQLDQHPIGSLLFFDSERIQVKAILTKMHSSARFTEDQLQYAANKALPEHIRTDFGRKAASLVSALSFNLSEVTVEGAHIYFPDGDLTVSYEAGGKNVGKLQYEASFSGSWLERPDRISKALAAFEMYPTEMTLKINGVLNLDRMRTGLPAGGWTITSHLDNELAATRMGYTLQASEKELRFSGLSPKELFGDDADLNKAALVSGVLGLLGK